MTGRVPLPSRTPGGRALHRHPAARAFLGLVLGAVVVAGGAGWAARGPGPLGDPAAWGPILDYGGLPPGAIPVVGSDADRTELAEVVALQASPSPAQLEAIAEWKAAGFVRRWNELLMEKVRDVRRNPVRAAREYAILNVAIHDAIVLAVRGTDPARPRPAERDPRIVEEDPAAGLGDPAALVAAAGAAETVLAYLHRGDRTRVGALADEAAAVVLWAGVGTRSEATAARSIGRAVGSRIVERARADGSNRRWSGTIPSGSTSWHPVAGQTRPLEPLAGTWRPWLLADGAELRPLPPPAVGSAAYRADAVELERIRADLTPAHVEMARFWADGAGSVTPAGHWLIVALDIARESGLDARATARVLAHLSMAQADSFIACWDAKYAYWTARPSQLIEGFSSAIPTPPFPAFPSGHAVQSAAAATVLAAAFPDRRAELERLATEAAESRILAGIHWRVDTTVGAEIGVEIGRRAVLRMSGRDPGGG